MRPVKEDLEAFIDRVNTRVTGDVVSSYKGSGDYRPPGPLALYSKTSPRSTPGRSIRVRWPGW